MAHLLTYLRNKANVQVDDVLGLWLSHGSPSCLQAHTICTEPVACTSTRIRFVESNRNPPRQCIEAAVAVYQRRCFPKVTRAAAHDSIYQRLGCSTISKVPEFCTATNATQFGCQSREHCSEACGWPHVQAVSVTQSESATLPSGAVGLRGYCRGAELQPPLGHGK